MERSEGRGFNIHFLFLAFLVASKPSSLFVPIIPLHILAVNYQFVPDCYWIISTDHFLYRWSCLLVSVMRGRWVGLVYFLNEVVTAVVLWTLRVCLRKEKHMGQSLHVFEDFYLFYELTMFQWNVISSLCCCMCALIANKFKYLFIWMYLKTVDRITVDPGETKHGLHGPFYIPRGRKQYHMRT